MLGGRHFKKDGRYFIIGDRHFIKRLLKRVLAHCERSRYATGLSLGKKTKQETPEGRCIARALANRFPFALCNAKFVTVRARVQPPEVVRGELNNTDWLNFHGATSFRNVKIESSPLG
ncbi:hypothetical protein ElyMa_006185900 [Elysia marginata]|uniref:Uncharacterized protein n=1 Tax=Elysia marginata TaxID=1093978 RepID=A0AAV4H2F7_9GAST|nr:hypothetical protein ElyMa_006185900 [Elysia marginata]